MQSHFFSYIRIIFVFMFALTACSSNNGPVVGSGYHSARAQAKLELPPDLINSTDEEYKSAEAKAQRDEVLVAIEGVEIKGAGVHRYLSVTASPEDTWRKMHDFVAQRELPILSESKQTGTLETDWIGDERTDSTTKKRMRSLLGNLVSRPPVNDKYKFWLERVDAQTTAIHVEHSRLSQILIEPERNHESIKSGWQESAGDEFHVVEMLRNLQTFFGGQSDEQLVVMVRLITEDENEQIVLAQSFDQAWKSTANAINASQYRILDINKDKNLFVIKERKREGGLLSKLVIKRKLGLKLEVLNESQTVLTATSKSGRKLDHDEALPVLYAITGELRKQ